MLFFNVNIQPRIRQTRQCHTDIRSHQWGDWICVRLLAASGHSARSLILHELQYFSIRNYSVESNSIIFTRRQREAVWAASVASRSGIRAPWQRDGTSMEAGCGACGRGGGEVAKLSPSRRTNKRKVHKNVGKQFRFRFLAKS